MIGGGADDEDSMTESEGAGWAGVSMTVRQDQALWVGTIVVFGLFCGLRIRGSRRTCPAVGVRAYYPLPSPPHPDRIHLRRLLFEDATAHGMPLPSCVALSHSRIRGILATEHLKSMTDVANGPYGHTEDHHGCKLAPSCRLRSEK